MRGDYPISDEELHAYVDGMIEPERRLQIAMYLAAHPLEAARTEAFRAQTDALHALFDGVLEQPLPHGWRKLIARCAASASRRRRLAWGLTGMAIMTALLLGGGTLRGFAPFHLGPGALVRGAAVERQGTEYPTVRSPGPMQRDGRGTEI